MTDVVIGREISARERMRVARILADEDKVRTELEAVLKRRDELLRALRWGSAATPPIRPESLRLATKCTSHPHGLSRTTFYRAVGRTKDRLNDHGSDDDGTT